MKFFNTILDNNKIDCNDLVKYINNINSLLSDNNDYYVKILKGEISTETFVNDIFKKKLIMKQIKACPPEIENVIRKISIENYEEVKRNLPSIDILNNYIKELMDICRGVYQKDPRDIIIKVKHILYYSLIRSGSIVMDAYLIGRLFRTFIESPYSKYNRYKQYYNQLGLNVGDSNYAMIFVGYAHARTYARALDYLGFTQIKRITNETQCLYIGGFAPFFSKNNPGDIRPQGSIETVILDKTVVRGGGEEGGDNNMIIIPARRKAKSKRPSKRGRKAAKKVKSKKIVKRGRRKVKSKKSKKSVKRSRRKPRVRKSVKRSRKKAKSKKLVKRSRKKVKSKKSV